MSKTAILWCCALAGTLPVLGQTEFSVQFNRARYDISPGETFPVGVLITPAPAAGVSSCGIKLTFPSPNALVAGHSTITPVLALNFDGVRGPGAVKATGDGFAAAKGTVDFFTISQLPYSGSPLLTVQLIDRGIGPYLLRLSPFNTLGPTEEIFVDGAGTVLDSRMNFGTALVNYRPAVRITSPLDGAVFIGPLNISIAAEATDLDGSITNVSFYAGSTRIGGVTRAPYSIDWSNAPVGTHSLTAVATDNLGAIATSSNVLVTVRPNSPPVLAPIGNQTVREGTLLAFMATATDPDAPPQTLTFSLGPGAPFGASITAQGRFTWMPTLAQGPATESITVRVSDSFIPSASDSETFLIVVTEPPLAPEPYAIFGHEANLTRAKVVNFNGNSHNIAGRIHSNSDIDVTGNNHLFRDSVVEHVTGINPPPNFKGKVTLQNSRVTNSTVKPYPVDFALSQFAPGGSIAAAAQAAGKYFVVTGDTQLAAYSSNGVLREGLYFVNGSIHLSGSGWRGKVTLVATGDIQLSAQGSIFESYTRCLFAFAGRRTASHDQPAIKISSSGGRWQGILFAPEGGIEITKSGSGAILGSLIARGVTVGAHGFQLTGLDLRQCAPLVAPLTPTLAGGVLQLAIPTVAGLTYVVEYSDSLSAKDWKTLSTVPGDGATKILRPLANAPHRFYRLRLE